MSRAGQRIPAFTVALFILFAATVGPTALHAQESTFTLAQVDSLVTAGRTEEARDALVAWWDQAGSRSREEAQRGLWLRGLLTVDPAQAAVDYQRLVVEYPRGAWSDRALLRLAQAADASGDPLRARNLLRSLLRDYPGSPLRLEAGRLLDQVAAAAATAAAAAPVLPVTSAQAETPDATANPDQIDILDEEVQVGVNSPAAPVPATVLEPAPGSVAVPPVDPVSVRSTEPADVSPASSELRWTVQLGAFASAARARALARSLADEPVQLRVVQIPGSPLFRVRAGRFMTEAEAELLRRDFLTRGRDATVSSDVHREESVP